MKSGIACAKIAWRSMVFAVATSPFASGQNLLTNSSFENGLSGWTPVSSSTQVVNYGIANAPSTAVSARIGGGGSLLLDLGGNGVIEQIVSIGAIAPGTNVRATGYFGGADSDDSRMVVRFLNAANGEISRENLDYATQSNRNFETVLLLREARLPIPVGTAKIAARIELRNNCCGVVGAAADMIGLELTSAPLIPPPLALNTELLNNPSFENGWSFGSPLSLTDPRGWEGNGPSSVIVKPYSNTDGTVPPTIVSCLIGGGIPNFSCSFGGSGNLLSDSGGNGVIRQRLDVRGNTPQFAFPSTVALKLSAYLGGMTDQPDSARVDVRFYNSSFVAVAPIATLGPVNPADRNEETVLVKREAEYPVPPNTSYIDVEVVFSNGCCGAVTGLIDLLSVKLVTIAPPAATPLNANLATNGSFEDSSLPGSPLEITNPKSWFGTASDPVEVRTYGSSSIVPSSGFAFANGLGGLVLAQKFSANASLRRLFDVSADSALINSGRLNCYLEAWLGGIANDQDMAEMRVRFLGVSGTQVGGTGGLVILGPVTQIDRANQTTLLKRSADVLIPPGTVTIEAEILFTNFCCSGGFGLADGIRVVLYDVVGGGPVTYPGSKEDLRLSSATSSPQEYPEPLTTGAGYDSKVANGDSILSLRVDSPSGTYNYVPMVLAANVYPTGQPKPQPPASLPSLAFDPYQMIFLLDGYFCGGFGCAVVLPGGTQLDVYMPPILQGNSVVVQALAIPIPGIGPLPINGMFAASEAHIIQM